MISDLEISVVVPVYNREDIVCRTLDSVMRQTHRPVHLIVVDNNSTDGSLTVLNGFKARNEAGDFKVTVLEEPRQGAAIARNTGARAAASEWLMFFDSDDVMDEGLLSRYADEIAHWGENCDMVHVDADWTDGRTFRRAYSPHGGSEAYNQILYSHFGTVRYIVRKSLFDEVGGWNETLGVLDDRELGIKLLLRAPRIVYVEDYVPVHIFHQTESITGESYSSKHQACERAIDAIETVIRASKASNEKSLLDILDFKRIHLAGLYALEGAEQLSLNLYHRTLDRLKGRWMMKCLFRFLYHNIASGRRGAVPIVKLFIKP